MLESRLFKIIYHLLNKGSSTAPELAEKFEVSVRTIYRDIDAISSAGIPIYATQGKGGGIALLENFVLDKSLLSSAEKEQLLMALQGLIATEGENSGELLTKLGSLFQIPNKNWIEVDFTNWTKGAACQDTFNLLKNAIFEKTIVSFQYFSGNKEISNRKAAPLKLVFKSKDWYLYGFCLLRNDYRFFKLTRVRDIRTESDVYPEDIVVPPLVAQQTSMEPTISALLKFDKKMAFRVYDEFTDDVTEDESGNLYVRTLLPDNDMLYSYLFSFSDYVEVIEPDSIRTRLKDKLSKMYTKYNLTKDVPRF